MVSTCVSILYGFSRRASGLHYTSLAELVSGLSVERWQWSGVREGGGSEGGGRG